MSDAYPADSVASIEPELIRPALKKYGEILAKETEKNRKMRVEFEISDMDTVRILE